MTASKNAVNLIASFEGLALKAYKDPGSVNGIPITIGYGTTAYENGKPIKLGDVITKERALALLDAEVQRTAKAVDALGVKFNQNQFDAITSFVYNIGLGAFKNSTLLRIARVNPNDAGIASQFAKWNKNDGKVMAGLTRRRAAESKLYFTPIKKP